MPDLVLCGGCERYFRSHETKCPFCGASASGAWRRRRAVLDAGASRSRRYAVSAAFFAGSAAIACAGGSDDAANTGTGGSGGSALSAGTGGATSGGRTGTGGANSVGGASATGGSNAGGASSTGGAKAAGGATASGRACEGHSERNGCRSRADCPSSGLVECVMVTPPRGCGNPTFLPSCPVDGCPPGSACVALACGESCQATCPDTPCASGTECVDGKCVPPPCDADGGAACGEGFVCDPSAQTPPSHCVPVRCDAGDYACQPWQQCLTQGGDAHGCAPVVCTADAECGDCGYCVNARCEPTLGFCYENVPMPYGCVWPDEELI